MLIAMAIGLTVTCTSPAAAQSCVSSPTSSAENYPSFMVLHAATTQTAVPGGGDCLDGRTVQVAAWVNGATFDCDPEVFDSQGNCFNENSDRHNAVVTIFSAHCGPWTGKSNHKYILNSATTNVELGRSTPLDGGSCGGGGEEYTEEECIALGYEWDVMQNGGQGGCLLPASPILISLHKNNKWKLTSVQDGVSFDIDGDGIPDEVAWTEADSDVAFLARDLNGDGQITSGKELFGNFTYPGVPNGYDALLRAAMESNGGIKRGSVSLDDPLFGELLLWTDSNHNGVSERWELRKASEVLAEIGLGYDRSDREDEFGNRFAFRGWANRRTAPGRNPTQSAKEDKERRLETWDVYLRAGR